jgi:hypothetical protein
MDFRLIRTQYDWESKRAYVELRAPDGEGEIIATVMFTLTPISGRSPKLVEQDIVTKARHIL